MAGHNVDLFWTFTHSAWNTLFKIVFLASSAYIIYLMLNEYRPTHDPNVDTFKVEYLLGGSAVMAILFPNKYTPYEVSGPDSNEAGSGHDPGQNVLTGSFPLPHWCRSCGLSPSG